MKTLIESNMKSTLPSLRLVLTSQCGGQCKYCHNEGNNVDGIYLMPKEMVLQAACYAESMNIPSICLTGGEPTLYPELTALIYKIQERFKGDINMTTNGDRLRQCLNGFSELHTINLSLTSLDQIINSKYQNVDPNYAFESLLLFPAKNKNLNIVVTEDNYLDIDKIIQKAIKVSVSVNIMFILKEYNDTDKEMQNYVLSILSKYGTPYISVSSTPEAIIDISSNCHIRIKHPMLSRLVKRKVCDSCTSSNICYERICAVRVYPNGSTSCCLNNYLMYSNDDCLYNIESIYKHFIDEDSCSFLSMILM